MNKKTICIFDGAGVDFNGDSINKGPLGGAETCVIQIAKGMTARGFNVFIFNFTNNPGVFDGVHYMHHSEIDFMKKFHTDLFVIVRSTKIAAEFRFKEYSIDKIALWLSDFAKNAIHANIVKASEKVDYIIAKSEWHMQDILNMYPSISKEKFVILRNGINLSLFDGDKQISPFKNRAALMYSSTPFRGLDIILEVFPKIKKECPTATLHIYSSLKLYGAAWSVEDLKYQPLYDKAKVMEGVTYHGSVRQKELAQAYCNCGILAYPNTYPETSCITVMEAMAAGCPVVSTFLAALPEAIPLNCGFLRPPPSTTQEYKDWFVDRIVALIKDENMFATFSETCKLTARMYGWDYRVQDWVKTFFPNQISMNQLI
jgi:glycosyltransferase involved in cell wall biosynthesis